MCVCVCVCLPNLLSSLFEKKFDMFEFKVFLLLG